MKWLKALWFIGLSVRPAVIVVGLKVVTSGLVIIRLRGVAVRKIFVQQILCIRVSLFLLLVPSPVCRIAVQANKQILKSG